MTDEQAMDMSPEQDPETYRAELIKRGLKDIDGQFQGRIKPIHRDLYYLIRNIAKYIVGQEASIQESLEVAQQKTKAPTPPYEAVSCERCGKVILRTPGELIKGRLCVPCKAEHDFEQKMAELRAKVDKAQERKREPDAWIDYAPQPTTWVECDRGWFGIDQEYYMQVRSWIDAHYCDGTCTINKDVANTKPSLFSFMSKAEHLHIPYAICTETPY